MKTYILDCEVSSNFFCCMLLDIETREVLTFELSPDVNLDVQGLNAILYRSKIIGFNLHGYDCCILACAFRGDSTEQLKIASDVIIKSGLTRWAFEKQFKVKVELYNSIDLIEVAPLVGSLKLYAARLHCPTIQDLPFNPDSPLTRGQAIMTKMYCGNDLENTLLLYNELLSDIKLREVMSQIYKVDLRSKSDAQIAEAVVIADLTRLEGKRPSKPKNTPQTLLYNVPDFIRFNSCQLQDVLRLIETLTFDLDGNGSPDMPKALAASSVTFGAMVCKLGMGGLHSTEKSVSHCANDDTVLVDVDVESFYPRTILNQRLTPAHLGDSFLSVYEKIVTDRIKAKHESALAKKEGRNDEATAHKKTADSLKIVINGLFGKFGNQYSVVYSPQLMLQVTITGQLVLLMMIEQLYEQGYTPVSANTDGVIFKFARSKLEAFKRCVKVWESQTGYKTEETFYRAIYNRDVNNYIAVKGTPDANSKFVDDYLGMKTKGVYSERGSALNSVLSKNPEHQICTDAVLCAIAYGTSIETTIRTRTDIRRFVSVKNVTGGAVYQGAYLGRVARWYYSTDRDYFIEYEKNGNKVAKSDGAKPMMTYEGDLGWIPDDLDYDWYINTAKQMLIDCGHTPAPRRATLFD